MDILRFLLALVLVVPAVPASGADPLPVATFFQKARYANVTQSPSGRHVAVLTPVKDRRNVAIMDLESREATFVTSFAESDAISIQWLDDERLVVGYGDLQIGSGEAPRVSGYVAVNRDGTAIRYLPRLFQRPWSVQILRTIPESGDVMVTARDRTVNQADLYRVNSRTGSKELLSFDTPGNVQQWILDFDHQPRAVLTSNIDDDSSGWYVRADARSPWKALWTGKVGTSRLEGLAFSPDGKTFYLRTRENRDRSAIVEYDIASGKMGEPIIAHPERDISGRFLVDQRGRKMLGFRYEDDQPSVVWFDAEHARIQKSVDTAFPDTVNEIRKAVAGERWIVFAHSDRNPGTVYLLDGKNLSVEKLLDFAPWFKPAEMAETRWVRYKARDGLVIPAMLTVPAGAKGKRLPLVVDIHGGPNVPATPWGFALVPQFLASRGYAVLRPQFRGTDGFGWKHYSSGFRRWGDEMQDDLEDGVKWAVAEGVADPDRVCFYGASYGGYAAMWGAIKNRDLIKCAVAFVGVSSIEYLFDNATTDLARFVERTSLLKEWIGDPATERARFKRVSPLDNADKVGVPLLLAYGAQDRRVPLVHGTDFRAALQRHDKAHEWVVYDGEGHGFNKTENLVDFFTRVDRFLARYLKP